MQSAIYSLDPGDKLKDYHKAINDACFEITKQNPSLVHDKKKSSKACYCESGCRWLCIQKEKNQDQRH